MDVNDLNDEDIRQLSKLKKENKVLRGKIQELRRELEIREHRRQAETRELRRQIGKLKQERHEPVQEQDELVQERYKLIQERDELVQERDVLVQERDVLVQERDVLVQEKSDWKRHGNELELETDKLATVLNQLIQERFDWERQRNELVLEMAHLETQRDNLIKQLNIAIANQEKRGKHGKKRRRKRGCGCCILSLLTIPFSVPIHLFLLISATLQNYSVNKTPRITYSTYDNRLGWINSQKGIPPHENRIRH